MGAPDRNDRTEYGIHNSPTFKHVGIFIGAARMEGYFVLGYQLTGGELTERAIEQNLDIQAKDPRTVIVNTHKGCYQFNLKTHKVTFMPNYIFMPDPKKDPNREESYGEYDPASLSVSIDGQLNFKRRPTKEEAEILGQNGQGEFRLLNGGKISSAFIVTNERKVAAFLDSSIIHP